MKKMPDMLKKKYVKSELVGRWIKKGRRKVYNTSFKTKEGAIRRAKQLIKEKQKKNQFWDIGKPFRWGKGWNIYIYRYYWV